MRKYTGVLLDSLGNPRTGASLSVVFTGTSNLVSLFDAGGVPISNPLTTDPTGQFAFHCHSGTYDVLDASSNPVLTEVQIFDHVHPEEWISFLTQNTRIVKRYNSATVGATVVIDMLVADIQELILGADITALTIANPTQGQELTLSLIQPASGGPFNIDGGAWPSNVKFPGGITPSLSSDPNAFDVFSFYYNGTLWLSQGEALNVQ